VGLLISFWVSLSLPTHRSTEAHSCRTSDYSADGCRAFLRGHESNWIS